VIAPLFTWRDGVHVPGTPLWCDARHTHSLCFLSHAGRPLRGEHRQILCTERTLRLLGSLLSGAGPSRGRAHGPDPGASPAPPGEALLTPFGRPFSLGGLRLELFPSGYLPGAASLLIRLQRGALVYAGDFNPTPRPDPQGRTLAEPMQVRAAEALLCHAPLAALGRPLPSFAEALDALRITLATRVRGAPLLILAPALGLAQELLPHLSALGLQVHLHRRIARACAAFQATVAAPSRDTAPVAAYRPPRPLGPGEVLLWPLGQSLHPLTPLGQQPLPPQVLLCAGAALSADVVSACREALPPGLELLSALPFPDGPDLPALLRYVADTEARDVYLTAGFSEEVAQVVRARTRARVQPLGPPTQMDLFAGEAQRGA
jgi:hypothetical protein